MADISSENSGKISRRDFIKLAALTAAGLGSGVVARERITFSVEQKIDMNNHLSKITGPNGRQEYTPNFESLRSFFPDVVKKTESGGYFLKNDAENPIILDFSNAADKEIRFFPNKTESALSNISWEDARQKSGFQEVTAGLILEGEFNVQGNLFSPPIFMGDGLDRIINFKGSGKENCKVEDIVFKGLNPFKQDASKKGGDCPSPAFIAGDNMNLEVSGIRINYDIAKPNDLDETNSQLAKGIILHNTENSRPLELKVRSSRIQGLEWDGICSNGFVKINVDNSHLIQNRKYKHERGVGIASTFNSPDGSIKINRSTIDYCKGTSIWVNQDLKPSTTTNLTITDTVINNSAWAISVEDVADQKVIIDKLKIVPDWDGTAQQDLNYWPLDFIHKGMKFDLSFNTIEFDLTPEVGSYARLLGQGSFKSFENLSDTTPIDFFKNNITKWGDIAINIQYAGEPKQKFTLTKDSFFDFLSNLKPEDKLNGGCVLMNFDIEKREFGVMLGTNFDSQTGMINVSEPFYVKPAIEKAEPDKAR